MSLLYLKAREAFMKDAERQKRFQSKSLKSEAKKSK